MKFGVVTEVSTFLVITQVSSDLKKSHILIFSTEYKYIHVKIATYSLANVKSCVTVRMFGPVQSQWITSQA